MAHRWPVRILTVTAVIALVLGIWSALEGVWLMAAFLWLFALGQVPLLAHAAGRGDRSTTSASARPPSA